MIRNYLKIALRNLRRNKGFSFINILGLAIGMASAILILLWIQHEWSYDKFHIKKDRIFQAWNRSVFSGKLQCWNNTPKVLASAIQRDNPEVEATTRVNWSTSRLFKVGEKSLMAEGTVVDSSFLQVFTYPMLKGDPKKALMDPASIVLTEKLAKKLFGDTNPLGKMITIDNITPLIVTGVLEDPPTNSKFAFEYLMPWARLRLEDGDDTFWGNNSCATYVLLKEKATLSSIAPRVKEMRRKYDPDDKQGEFFLYPLEKWRLYSQFENGIESGGFIEFVRLFAIIAAFILLIACINFMNLSTARSERRAREVGIRKVIGAQKSALIGQFLGESILIAILSGLVALAIVQLGLPAFGELTGQEIQVDYSNPRLWIYLITFILFTGLLAGSYPAFFLSSFKPVVVLKGSFKKVNALVTPRKVLVVLQFTFAIILMIATLVVRNQIQHARERETGYNKNNLVYTFTGPDVTKNYMLIKNELIASGVALSVTKTSAPMTQGWSNTWGIDWPGKDPNDKTIIDRFCADDKVAATMGLQLFKGRDLDLGTYPTDSSAALVNESAAKLMGFQDPIGAVFKDDSQEWHIVGVVKDFIINSPYQPTIPMVIEGAKAWFNCVHVKLNPAHTTSANIAAMEKIYKKYSPHYPFEYKFIDKEYDEKFKAEQRAGTLSGLFAGLTIFISCLGLFGLATYMAENRIKEIGVRKILGASVTDITTLLSKDFLKLVIVSLFIASPVAWWLMSIWLEDFKYRIDVPVSAFLIAGGLSLLIALLTVSSQAIKAAVSNPVKSLRTE